MGIVNVLVVPVVIPDNWNCIIFVASTSSIIEVLASTNDLLVNVSIPALVAKVPVVGRVTVVTPVDVKVVEKAPLVTKLLLSANVKVAPVAGWVKVNLFIDVAVATPNTGVTKVGEVAKTRLPEPVSSEITPNNCADVVAAN